MDNKGKNTDSKDKKNTDLDHHADKADKKRKKINNIHLDDHEKEKYAYLNFSKDPERKKRYKAFKDSKIDSSKIKRYLSSAHNVTAGDLTALILAAVSKIYLGELVEEARAIMTHRDEIGPIQPMHLKLAYQKLVDQGKMQFYNVNMKKLFA
jgi:hypothetical protein